MHDDGDTVIGQNGLLQAGRLLLVLQRTGGKTDVAGTLLHGGDAGAGAGGVVAYGDALVVGLESLAQGHDDLFHRGRAVGADCAGHFGVVFVIGAAAVVAFSACGEQSKRHERCKN